MAIIRPFKGIFYNQEKVDISKVTAPPYDIISKKEAERFYRESNYNIIRLIRGKIISPHLLKTKRENRYTEAANLFSNWLKSGILIQADKPIIYLYRQKYSLASSSRKKIRLGFISLLKLNQEGKGIFLHEQTFSIPIKDRIALLQKCQANFSSIFCLYEDKQKDISITIKKYLRKRPNIDFCDSQQIEHSLWAIEKENVINSMIEKMRGKPIYIADGHHRYSAALKFYQRTKTKESAFVLAYLAEMSKENISILPTHRVVYLTKEQMEIFKQRVKKFFEIKPISKHNKKSEFYTSSALEIYWQGQYYLLIPKFSCLCDSFTLVHNILIKKVLRLNSFQEKEKIRYTHSHQEAVELATKNKGMAFFIKPLRLEEIKRIIRKGETLPQKSTYFYPKLLTGLVIRKFAS